MWWLVEEVDPSADHGEERGAAGRRFTNTNWEFTGKHTEERENLQHEMVRQGITENQG